MKDLSNDIINSIEKRTVKPISRWQYITRKLLFWTMTCVLVLLGALSLALAIYLVQSIDWNMYAFLGYGSFYSFLMSAFPYGFILLLIIFLILAYYFYRQTPKGHKLNLSMLATMLLVFGLSLAFLLYILGISREAYFQLARMPFYHQMMFTKEGEWSQPGKGLLWGEVLSVDNNNFSLRDVRGKNWNVSYGSNASLDENLPSSVGENVKIIGKMINENEFQAQQIYRWDGVMNCNGKYNMMNGRGMMRNGGMMGRRGMMR